MRMKSSCIDVLSKASALFIASAALALIFSVMVLSQPKPEISEYQKRLSRLSSEIAAIKTRIKRLEKEESTTLSRLDSIAFQKSLIRKEISVYNLRMDKANQELSVIKKSIPPLKAKLEQEKQSIEKILITLYKFGRFSEFQLMLEAQDLSSLLSEAKNLSLLARYQEHLISDYAETLEKLRKAESELEAKKDEISMLIAEAQQKRRELAVQEKKSRTLIREIERNKKTHLKTLEELNERAEQLRLLVKKLLEREITLPITLIPLYERKGKLPWPLEGRLISRFGIQRHPRFNTLTINNGIEIAPKKDNVVVKAIHPGKIVYADYFQGYGYLVIIDHGMSYYSLYGHCSDFLIKKGDFVDAGQPIALIGDISSLKGVSLYLEIRYKTKPLNPLLWLRRR